MSEDSWLDELPLKETWLAAIVDALMHRPDGTGEIEAITNTIMRTGRDMGSAPEATITRTINNHCSDAKDSGPAPEHDLFERVAPATYRLRSFPNRPDLLEIQAIEFTSFAYKKVWEYVNIRLKNDSKWKNFPKIKKLKNFYYLVREGGQLHDMLQVYQQGENISSDLELRSSCDRG